MAAVAPIPDSRGLSTGWMANNAILFLLRMGERQRPSLEELISLLQHLRDLHRDPFDVITMFEQRHRDWLNSYTLGWLEFFAEERGEEPAEFLDQIIPILERARDGEEISREELDKSGLMAFLRLLEHHAYGGPRGGGWWAYDQGW